MHKNAPPRDTQLAVLELVCRSTVARDHPRRGSPDTEQPVAATLLQRCFKADDAGLYQIATFINLRTGDEPLIEQLRPYLGMQTQLVTWAGHRHTLPCLSLEAMAEQSFDTCDLSSTAVYEMMHHDAFEHLHLFGDRIDALKSMAKRLGLPQLHEPPRISDIDSTTAGLEQLRRLSEGRVVSIYLVSLMTEAQMYSEGRRWRKPAAEFADWLRSVADDYPHLQIFAAYVDEMLGRPMIFPPLG